jgi:hypothetical protein
MTYTKIQFMRIALAATAGAACLFVSEQMSPTNLGSFVTQAHAIIGRPLTPMSYAGVARRTTARAYGAYGAYGAVAVAPVVVAPVVVAPACAQVVNAYGQIVLACR